MSRSITIVLALCSEGKTVQATCCANGGETAFAASKDFMNVALVADIPNKFVVRCGKDIVQRNGQFYHPQIGPQMPSVGGEFCDQFRANFVRQYL